MRKALLDPACGKTSKESAGPHPAQPGHLGNPHSLACFSAAVETRGWLLCCSPRQLRKAAQAQGNCPPSDGQHVGCISQAATERYQDPRRGEKARSCTGTCLFCRHRSLVILHATTRAEILTCMNPCEGLIFAARLLQPNTSTGRRYCADLCSLLNLLFHATPQI